MRSQTADFEGLEKLAEALESSGEYRVLRRVRLENAALYSVKNDRPRSGDR